MIGIAFPNISIQVRDTATAFGCGHIAVKSLALVGGHSNRCAGVRHGLRPGQISTGIRPALVVEDLVVVRAVQQHRVDRINLYWAATKIGADSPVLVPPYSVSTVLAEYSNPSQQFLTAGLQEVPAQAGIEVIDLPEPWGRTTFIHSQHSEPLTVPFSQGIADKGIREFTWKLSLPQSDHEAWVGLVKAGFGACDEPVTVKGGTVRPLDVQQGDRSQHQEKWPSHSAAGKSRNSFRHRTGDVRWQTLPGDVPVIGHPNPLYDDYADAGTSMNMSIGVQQILRKALGPGVWAPEEYFDTEPFLAELRKRYFSVEIETDVWEES